MNGTETGVFIMMDPFSFNQLGKIRQQEILEEAERNRDAMTFGEMGRALVSLIANGWRKAKSIGVSHEVCEEATSPSITTETC
jgi:hypothetical protein